MTAELVALALAVLLQAVYFGAYAYYGFSVEEQVPSDWALGPRDEERPVSGITARAKRAEANYVHGFVFFAAAALVIAASRQSSAFTAACAWLFLLARIAYLPAYLFGWVPWRSIAWGVSHVATLFMALAALI